MVREKGMPVFPTYIFLILLFKFRDIWVGLSVHMHTCRRVHRVTGIKSPRAITRWCFATASSVHKCLTIFQASQILCRVKWVQGGMTWGGGSEIHISFWGEKMNISTMIFLTLNIFPRLYHPSWHILHAEIMVLYIINILFGHLVYSGKYEQKQYVSLLMKLWTAMVCLFSVYWKWHNPGKSLQDSRTKLKHGSHLFN